MFEFNNDVTGDFLRANQVVTSMKELPVRDMIANIQVVIQIGSMVVLKQDKIFLPGCESKCSFIFDILDKTSQ